MKITVAKKKKVESKSGEEVKSEEPSLPKPKPKKGDFRKWMK